MRKKKRIFFVIGTLIALLAIGWGIASSRVTATSFSWVRFPIPRKIAEYSKKHAAPRASESDVAVKKICTDPPYELEIFAFSNDAGDIGGYTASASPRAEVSDAGTSLYDAHGVLLATDSLFYSQQKRDAYREMLTKLQDTYPHFVSFLCPSG
jgi:hypothetical protein